MEKRVNRKIELYITAFKDSIRSKLLEINISDKSILNDLLEYVYDYQRLVLTKDDLIKRKRIKNSIPSNNRCNAKRANGEQCTRRRKEDCEFCGTHAKGAPHGYYNDNSDGSEASEKKVEVIAEEILGIVYYIDGENNVYRTEDILENKINPKVIAKCTRTNGKLTIPDLGLV